MVTETSNVRKETERKKKASANNVAVMENLNETHFCRSMAVHGRCPPFDTMPFGVPFGHSARAYRIGRPDETQGMQK